MISKKIGEEYYYNVYKESETRVIKKIKNKIRVFMFVAISNKLNIKNAIEEYKTVIESIPKFKVEYQKILNLVKEKEIIGNPIFINDIEYSQDIISLFGDLSKMNNEEFTKIINDYV